MFRTQSRARGDARAVIRRTVSHCAVPSNGHDCGAIAALSHRRLTQRSLFAPEPPGGAVKRSTSNGLARDLVVGRTSRTNDA